MHELSNELKTKRLRYPKVSQKVAQKCDFAVLRVNLDVYHRQLQSFFYDLALQKKCTMRRMVVFLPSSNTSLVVYVYNWLSSACM